MPEKVTIEPPPPETCGPIRYESHAQAQSSIMSKMARLMGFRRKTRPILPEAAPIYIFNISDQELAWQEPGFPRLVVPACQAGKEFSKPLRIEGIVLEEYLEDRSTEFNVYNGVEIAYAVLKIGPGMKKTLDLTDKGFFMSRSNPPSAPQLAEAKAKYLQNCQLLLNEADRIIASGESKGLNGQMINETHKRAAAYLKQTREWNKSQVEMMDCPGCQQPIPKVTAVHGGQWGCGAVLDWNKAISLGLKKPEDRPASPEKDAKKN